MNRIIISVGSNINPRKNIRRSIQLLSHVVKIEKKSNIWITEAYGDDGPDFLNMALLISTEFDADYLKTTILTKIESDLKRVRTGDKYAPRTIDLDIIIFNGEILDNDLWTKVFLALPISEIEPNILIPNSGKTLLEIAQDLKRSTRVKRFALDA